MDTQYWVILAIGAFMVYRIYRRVLRNLTWQPLSVKSLTVYTVLFGVVGLLFFAEGASHAVSLISDFVGILLGAALAAVSAANTRCEQQGGQWKYRTNPWIGGLVIVLFIGRLVFRVYQLIETDAFSEGASGTLSAMAGGWTSGLLLVLFAYYVVYNSLLLRRAKARA
ncbi:hypothetical protein [Cohnella caldifontis]|uniref:hypothetical protein n=1 Tax=Cohnella caldifontis TaxID=3027471 RepID=UPI0023EC7252|nr:hypothetical protein [Cohnella sp. YIM B05605]